MSWQSSTRVMYSLTPWGPGVLKKTDLWYSQIAQSGVVLKVGWRLIMFQLSPPPSPLTYTDEWTRWGLEPTAERGSNKGMFPLIFLDVMWEIHISSTSQVRNPYYLLQLACITESQKQTCYSLWQRLAGADYFVLTKRRFTASSKLRVILFQFKETCRVLYT